MLTANLRHIQEEEWEKRERQLQMCQAARASLAELQRKGRGKPGSHKGKGKATGHGAVTGFMAPRTIAEAEQIIKAYAIGLGGKCLSFSEWLCQANSTQNR